MTLAVHNKFFRRRHNKNYERMHWVTLVFVVFSCSCVKKYVIFGILVLCVVVSTILTLNFTNDFSTQCCLVERLSRHEVGMIALQQ